MKSKFLTSATLFAVLTTGAGPVPIAATQAREAPGQGFCRTADPLPRLDPEVQPQQQQSSNSVKTKGGSKRDRAIATASE
ncbi:hypothetical protein, partial [Sphingopyxis sp. 2PD]|uniref:hypothetical protein n=1 Tax=Sphingopyxis sp. 2PD TaxID=2502196 RepID=UPI0010F69549